MNRLLYSVCAIWFLVNISFATPPQFLRSPAREAQIEFRAKLQKLERDHIHDTFDARSEYIKKLERSLKLALKNGQLELAEQISSERDRLEKIQEVQKEYIPNQKDRFANKIWYRLTPNEPQLIVRFETGGKIRPINRSTSFIRWSYSDGLLTLRSAKGKLMEFISAGPRFFVPPVGADYRHVWVLP